jgi:hypothetical protein
MAGTLIVSNITTDTDNTFIVRSNTGTTLFSANTTGIDVANSIGATAITNDKILSVANTKITGTLSVATGGTGAATLTANNVLLGNGTSALQVVAPGTTGNLLTSNGTTWTSSAAAAQQTSIIVSYVVGPTTDGGTATGSTTQTRPLNTVNYNGITGASLASNAVTLPAGNYFVNAIASAFLVGQFRYILRNTTASTNLVLGAAAEATGIEILGNIIGQFTLSTTSTVELQMYCNTTRGGDGMGTNGGGLPPGVNSVYAVMQLTKF